MREFKFRVWDTKHKKFLIGIPPMEYMLDHDEWSWRDIEEDPCVYLNNVFSKDFNGRLIFQQYTGLTDSKGNHIYEGDIIKEHHFEDWGDKIGYEYIGIVVYKMCSDGILFAEYKTIPAKNQNTKFRGNAIQSDCEVIGNIFENPELLKTI